MKRDYRRRILMVFSTLLVSVFLLSGCGNKNSDYYYSVDSREYKAKETFLETFAVLYMSQPDVVIADDSIDYGNVACDDCTYVTCDTYTTNGNQLLWHNLAIINTEGAITWYFYSDDGGLANYRMKDNPHNFIDVTNKRILSYEYSYTSLDYISQSYKAWDNIDMGEFLPKKEMLLNYSGIEGEYSVAVTPRDGYVEYLQNGKSGDHKEGTLRYDYSEWALINKEFLANGDINEFRYAIPGGKGYENSDGTYVSAIEVLFTVETPAGIFENCYATPFQKIKNEESGEYVLKFYAPGVGYVMAIDVKPNQQLTLVEQLINIDDNINENTSKNDNVVAKDNTKKATISLNDYQKYENIAYSKHQFEVRVLENNDGQENYKLEFNNGKEYWLEFNSSLTDGDEYDILLAGDSIGKATIYYDEPIINIEINGADFSGAYIQLPDSEEDDENYITQKSGSTEYLPYELAGEYHSLTDKSDYFYLSMYTDEVTINDEVGYFETRDGTYAIIWTGVNRYAIPEMDDCVMYINDSLGDIVVELWYDDAFFSAYKIVEHYQS